MKVLHFYKTYYPDSIGGVEQVIRQICQTCTPLGVQSEVLTLSNDPSPEPLAYADHKIHQAKRNFEIASTGFSLEAIKRLSRLAAAADLVHYHFPWPFGDLAHFISRHGRPSIVTYHSDIIRQKRLVRLYRPLKHRFLQSVDRIVATSPNYLQTSEVLDLYREKVAVVPIGLDRASYPKPDPSRLSYWRERLGGRFFLFVGLIRYYKGLHILLDALQEDDYPVAIVGAGPIEDELKAHARRIGLRHTHFLGQLSDEDKVALLQLCYGIVFPSHLRSEAFGVSLLEGAMFGKPMISSEIGTGTSYINVNGVTGLGVPPSDPQAFREAMRVLWNTPEAAAAMGEQAERRYLDLFTAERMAASYVGLYKELLAKGK